MCYLEVICDKCNAHMGWMTDSGPGPFYVCDSCKEWEEENEGEEDDA